MNNIKFNVFKTLLKFSFVIGGLFLSNVACSQLYFNLNLEGNYWEHTDLYGGQIGAGLEYKLGRLGIRASYGIGYGETDRFKNFPNVRFDDIDVFINHKNGTEAKFNRDQTSDYARQHQIDLAVYLRLFRLSPKVNLNLQAGVFFSRIQHYYIIDHVVIEHFGGVIADDYELDLLIISDQQFYTVGLRTELNMDIELKNGFIMPYVALGLGPNFTNFGTVGVRYSGILKEN